MQVKTSVAFQPAFDEGTLMSAVVVHNQLQVQFLGSLLIDLVKKPDELKAAMPWRTFPNDFPVQQSQGGKQAEAAMFVVLRLAAENSLADGQ